MLLWNPEACLLMEFNPVEYWNTREHPNTSEDPGIGAVELETFPDLLKNSTRTLELGPGVGRLFPLYTGKDIYTLDLSKKYSERLRHQALLNNVKLTEFFANDPAAKFPFEDDYFDLAIAAHVLYHVPFKNIVHTIKELYRVSTRALAIVSNNPKWPVKSDDYPAHLWVFNHNYQEIFEELRVSKVTDLYPERFNKVYLLEKN
ncbi:MAG: hypothetical protein CMC19_01160 [Flavobacteriaceae bacterium]|nr:hypothetical protein [Flavobacteriaceae bacterium]